MNMFWLGIGNALSGLGGSGQPRVQGTPQQLGFGRYDPVQTLPLWYYDVFAPTICSYCRGEKRDKNGDCSGCGARKRHHKWHPAQNSTILEGR